MSSRVTRSAARLAADSAASSPTDPPPPTNPPQPPPTTRKRKASARRSSTSDNSPPQNSAEKPRRSTKRQKTSDPPAAEPPPAPPHSSRPTRGKRTRASTEIMSGPSSSTKAADETTKSSPPATSRSRSNKNKKGLQDPSSSTQPPSTSRRKKRGSKKDSDLEMKEAPAETSDPVKTESDSPPPEEHSDGEGDTSPQDNENDDMDDPFGRALFGGGRGTSQGLQSTLRALSGMMSGMSSRLRDILNNLRQKDNPNMQLVALEEFSNLLLISNEDNLSGQFSPDPYVKELVTLMQPNEITGEENPEIMLLACRCIANLMEALRGSVANVVYGGAVPVLCQKLLDIQYIDVAEQALITLSKISVDFPASIVREGGLTACLQFLDFFATGTQRTAVQTAANCCRNIPHDSFPVIRDVMPILLNVLSSHDQKVVEQGCLCVTRVIHSFKHYNEKLEELVQPDLLRAILRLLLPGTTNLIGANIHTEFLKVLAIIARASPTLSVELLKMNVVDTLYQILTGVSPPNTTTDGTTKIDSVVIMQALIHRPREQVFETLNVICEILPPAKLEDDFSFEDFDDVGSDASEALPVPTRARKGSSEKRVNMLSECYEETRRFAMILLPTLTDAYSSTVNLSVRQKVLTAHLKILSNLDTKVIEDALRPVPYASFLASILSQQDHSSLVMSALQASELLYERLESIYQYQFYREGVIAEIKKLGDRPLKVDSLDSSKSSHTSPSKSRSKPAGSSTENAASSDANVNEKIRDEPEEQEDNDDLDEDHDDDQDEDADDDDESHHEDDNDHSHSESSDSSSGDEYADPIIASGMKDILTIKAKEFLRKYETPAGQEFRARAGKILQDLQSLALDIENCYLGEGSGEGTELFMRLSKSFDGDALESITSSELLNSDIVRILVNVFSPPVGRTLNGDAKKDFLEAFLGTTVSTNQKSIGGKAAVTPFSVLTSKLQDLLSRSEHFEVLTVNHNASESNRSNATSMLSKQLRLKLTADEESDIPRQYRDITVSIHAIATFKALDDYLRPRISLAERPSSGSRRREAILARLAAARYQDLAGTTGESNLRGLESQSIPTTPSNAPMQRPASTVKSAPDVSSHDTTAKTDKPKRKSGRTGQSSSAAPPAEPSTEASGNPIECADERQMSDDDEDDGVRDEALEAIVDDLDDEMSDEDLPDPTAVNMEVATTGRVTARKEDGTRVATPHQPGTPATPSSRPASGAPRSAGQPPPQGGLALAGRPFSYAAAVASIPQDWHIEFSIDGKAIPKETTIYGAVHHNRDEPHDPTMRSIWSGIHPVRFTKVKGPPPTESTIKAGPEGTEKGVPGQMPTSLSNHPTTSSILSLLKALHEMNANLDDLVEDKHSRLRLTPEPLSQFINTKLTAKMNRQLEEPLIVASNCLPHWSEDLARLFPFLFPFETRHLFLQSTSFGYSRSMMRWQSAQSENDDRRDRRRDDRPLMGRLQRQKVRISRQRILESAVKVMELYGASPSVLEVEYFEEVGTGLGPTLEFYSTVSKEFSKKKLKLWRENDSQDSDEYAFGKLGLFPAPMSEEQANQESGKRLLHLYKILGKFVARSMLDSRIIDVSFNPTFFRIGNDSTLVPSLALVKSVDQDLANSLSQVNQFAKAKARIEQDMHMTAMEKVRALQSVTIRGARLEDLMLDFTLPGYPSIELVPNGSNTNVTLDNVDTYVDRVLELTLGSGVRKQIEAFQTGFSQVFSYASLRAFTPNELVMLFGRVEEDWTMETLTDSIKADHGFNMDSKSVKNLLQTMSELTKAQRRDFLQFVTGSPKLPIGGFKSLTPMFTVVCKPSEPPYTSDDYLPSVMTCVNYLKLPDYTNLDVLRERLNVAIKEGQGAFHLS